MLQTEATECGLACLAMVAGHYGDRSDLTSLRQRFPVSLKGATLAHLLRIAEQLKLGSRPVKLHLRDLGNLKLPCVLHWNFNHFVVLTSVGNDGATILDPAHGKRRLSMDEGVARVHRRGGQALAQRWLRTHCGPRQQVRHRSLLKYWRAVPIIRADPAALAGAGSLRAHQPLLDAMGGGPCDREPGPRPAERAGDRVRAATADAAGGFAARSWVMMSMSTTLSVQWRANVFNHLLRLPTGTSSAATSATWCRASAPLTASSRR